LKKNSKISLKIEIIGTCLNLQESLEGTLGVLGLTIKGDIILTIPCSPKTLFLSKTTQNYHF